MVPRVQNSVFNKYERQTEHVHKKSSACNTELLFSFWGFLKYGQGTSPDTVQEMKEVKQYQKPSREGQQSLQKERQMALNE